jgi:hypothetical protein
MLNANQYHILEYSGSVLCTCCFFILTSAISWNELFFLSDFDEYPFHYLGSMIMNWVRGCYLFMILIDTHLIKFMIMH